MGLISNGTTVFDNGSMSSGFGGNMVFIKKLTASSSATLSFVDGSDGVVLDDTYKEYVFTFKNIHPTSDAVTFQFQGNAAGESGYNETIQSSTFRAYHGEGDGGAGVGYRTDDDQANGTAFQKIDMSGVGSDNDQSCSGYMHLFNPSSTTFVKHFISRISTANAANYLNDNFVSGYFNITSAIDEIQFKMSSGNIDSGDICLYGIT